MGRRGEGMHSGERCSDVMLERACEPMDGLEDEESGVTLRMFHPR